jgi:CDP-glucose 4,6-dehydratase
MKKKNFWKKRKVLITGATGFIGSNLVRELIRRDADVFSLMHNSDFETGGIFSLAEKKKIHFVQADVRDYEKLAKIFTKYKINTCFHLAAQPLVMTAFESPLPTFDTNIRGTINILEAARCSRYLKRLVVASTTHVYGNNRDLPYIESFSTKPSRPYETSKACADMLAQTYYYTYGLPVAMTRMTNTYGPGDNNFSRLIPKVIKAIVEGKDPEIIGGMAVRDYLYVKDAVSGYLALAENVNRQEIRGEAFNFGSGQISSALEVAQKILRISNKKNLKLKIYAEVELKKEIDKQYVSTEKAKSLLSWSPKYSLERGLKETYNWYVKNVISL